MGDNEGGPAVMVGVKTTNTTKPYRVGGGEGEGGGDYDVEAGRPSVPSEGTAEKATSSPVGESSCWGIVGLSRDSKKFLSKMERGWFVTSYIGDYLLTGLLFIISYIVEAGISPFRMEMPGGVDNYNYDYSYREESIPTWLLCIIAYAIPGLAVLSINLLSYALRCRKKVGCSWFAHDSHNFLLGFAETAALTGLFTAIGKVVGGRFRPNYFAMPTEVRDAEGRLSFPSGHSSIAFSAFTFLSLYIAGKLKVFDDKSGQFWKVVLVLVPEIPAFMIALSRTRDYWHHFSDIVGGAFIGVGIAIMCYYSLYPSLSHPNCDAPKRRTPITALPSIRH
ncbi:phosphatidic acid phosphatase type 2/haloperoxidase [Pelomyxa schiedti]|nr:phosphatidic acid phosphatase type 2/haloperoxidase [Pelomyxa schiedti]